MRQKKVVLVPSTRFEGRQDLLPPCTMRKRFVGGGNFPSIFLEAGTECLDIGPGAGVGDDHCGSIGNNGERLLVASVSGMISMWS